MLPKPFIVEESIRLIWWRIGRPVKDTKANGLRKLKKCRPDLIKTYISCSRNMIHGLYLNILRYKMHHTQLLPCITALPCHAKKPPSNIRKLFMPFQQHLRERLQTLLKGSRREPQACNIGYTFSWIPPL
jgi:hypothetical protein